MKRLLAFLILSSILFLTTGCGSQARTRLSPDPHQEALTVLDPTF